MVTDSSGSVYLLSPSGDGGLATPVALPAGINYGASVAVGDVTGDGVADIVVIDSGDVDVVVLVGDSDGGFSLPGPIAFGVSSLQSVVLTTFQAGGGLSAAVTDPEDDQVWLLGDWSSQPFPGHFGALSPVNTGSDQPYAIGAGHVLAGEFVDLITSDQANYFLSLLPTLVDGGFTYVQGDDVATSDAPYALAVADFNGDGVSDVAVVLPTMSSVAVYYGDPSLGLGSTPTWLSPGGTPSGIVAADFNGDGLPDIAVATSPSSATIILNVGDAGFAAPQTFPTGSGPVAIVAGDFNGDGIPDLATADTGDTVSILLGAGCCIPTGQACSTDKSSTPCCSGNGCSGVCF